MNTKRPSGRIDSSLSRQQEVEPSRRLSAATDSWPLKVLSRTIALRDFRHRPAKFRRFVWAGGGETLKRTGFRGVPAFSGWRNYCPYRRRASRVSSSSLFDRPDAGIGTKRQPPVQGLVFRHDVRRVPASGLNDVTKRERPRQLQNRRRWVDRVCSRRCAAHHCCSGRAERRRRSSVPIGPFAY